MNFSDEIYESKAVEQHIVADVKEIATFTCGHLRGLEAIKLIFNTRSQQVVLALPRTNKRLFEATIEKFRNGYYNGKLLDAIICDASKFLGERYALHQTIVSANNSCPRVLSRDGLYALPAFTMRDVDPCDMRFSFYDKIFDASELEHPPRSREDIVYFLEKPLRERGVYPYDLDMVISYLVRRGLL